jgi:glycosyltransferase involved in cell wall biosynthesis
MATIVELLAIAVDDDELRRELRERGRRRVETYDFDSTALTLRRAIEAVAA